MAFSSLRIGVCRHVSLGNWLSSKSRLYVASPIQIATLKATYGEKFPYEKPWDYKNKTFNVFKDMMDIRSRKRLTENSKVICVEGNIGVGKNDFAKQIAKEFDLKYIPSVTCDDIFTGDHGFDVRILDLLLSEGAQSYDLKKFMADPNPESGRLGMLQTGYFRTKILAYIEGLYHLMSTGQGIVYARSAFSDRVFLEAFRRLGWVSRHYRKHYIKIWDDVFVDVLRPHVTLYLDAPLDVCMKRYKEKNKPTAEEERKVSLLMPELDKEYQNWLRTERHDHEVLEIDWTDKGDDLDMDVIAEGLEELNLECFNNDDNMFRTWFDMKEDDMAFYRHLYQQTNRSTWDNMIYREFPWDAPEAMFSQDQRREQDDIMSQHPLFCTGEDEIPLTRSGDVTLKRHKMFY